MKIYFAVNQQVERREQRAMLKAPGVGKAKYESNDICFTFVVRVYRMSESIRKCITFEYSHMIKSLQLAVE